jgi:hypothetical protein
VTKKPSLNPQRINSTAWYYENKGSIDIIVDIPTLARNPSFGKGALQIRISKSKLKTSLARMQ